MSMSMNETDRSSNNVEDDESVVVVEEQENDNDDEGEGVGAEDDEKPAAACATLEQMKPYFEMPLQEAAAQLKTSTSTLNRSAKQLGLSGWPYRRFRSLKRSINDVSLKLQRCIENGNHGDKEAAHRAELHRLHAKLLALRNNPTQVNHIVWRTSGGRPSKSAGSASNVAEGLEMSIAPRSFEHALESLLFILQRHMPTGNRPAVNSHPLFIPFDSALPSASSAQQPPAEQSPRTPVAHQQLGAVVMRAIHSGDSRSAFKRMRPTPTLSSAMSALGPPAAKRATITSQHNDNNNDSQS